MELAGADQPAYLSATQRYLKQIASGGSLAVSRKKFSFQCSWNWLGRELLSYSLLRPGVIHKHCVPPWNFKQATDVLKACQSYWAMRWDPQICGQPERRSQVTEQWFPAQVCAEGWLSDIVCLVTHCTLWNLSSWTSLLECSVESFLAILCGIWIGFPLAWGSSGASSSIAVYYCPAASKPLTCTRPLSFPLQAVTFYMSS